MFTDIHSQRMLRKYFFRYGISNEFSFCWIDKYYFAQNGQDYRLLKKK